jgi:drug/metabolite transporter (DMT)-like permease
MTHHWGYMAAVLSAVTYGISYSLNKLLLINVPPIMLAGIVYLSSGAYLIILRLLPKRVIHPLYRFLGLDYVGFPTLKLKHLMMLALVVMLGAFAGPITFYHGLKLSKASVASLTAISELILTLAIAWLFLKERFSKLEVIAMALIALGVVIIVTNLSLEAVGVIGAEAIGAVLIILACLFWALDNNLSKVLALRGDVIEVSTFKALLGGALLLIVSLILGELTYLSLDVIAVAIFVGIISLGNSLLLFFVGLYHIGAGRTIAIFSSNTLFGILWSLAILKEAITFPQVIAFILVFIGIYILYEAMKRKE